MLSRMKISLAVFAVGLLIVACSQESRQTEPVKTKTDQSSSTAPPAKQAENEDKALVRVLNANPKGSGLDVFAEKTKTFAQVGYKEVTPYREVPGGKVTFQIRTGGEETSPVLAENTEMLMDGSHYTLISMPDKEGKGCTLRVVSDDLAPEANKARIRVINASPDIGEVDVIAKERNKEIFSGVNFKSEAGYKKIDPMTASLEVLREDKKNVLVTVPNQKWEAGKMYTIVVTGPGGGTRPSMLEAIAVRDEIAPGSASS